MRVPRRPSRFVLVTASIVLCLAAGAVAIKLAYYPSPIDGVCRSLGPEHDFEPVPGDVLQKAAQTLDVRLRDLEQPTVEQLEAIREATKRETGGTTVARESVACLVDYSRSGNPGDPDADPPVKPTIERNHVPALLVYREVETAVDPCFNVGCGDEPTYKIHCAGFNDAATGRLLRQTGCWGFREQ